MTYPTGAAYGTGKMKREPSRALSPAIGIIQQMEIKDYRLNVPVKEAVKVKDFVRTTCIHNYYCLNHNKE